MEKRSRDYYFDNARWILIFLVVLAHSIRPFDNSSNLLHTLYVWIYFFHMPSFIIISGYFSKGFQKEGYYKKLVIKLLFPYAIFECLYSLFISIIFNEHFELTFFTPFWITWFLLSLFGWQLLLFVFTKLPYPFFISILVAVLAGYIDELGKDFSLLRTLTFFPFFLLGHLLQKSYFSYLQNLKIRIGSILFLVGLFGYIHLSQSISLRWLWSSRAYSYYGFDGLEAAQYRIAYFIVMFLACAAFFSLITNKKSFFSNLGSYTMYTYLLHGFLIRILLYKHKIIHEIVSAWDFILLLGFVLFVCFITTLPVIRKLFSFIIEPYHLFLKSKTLLEKKALYHFINKLKVR